MPSFVELDELYPNISLIRLGDVGLSSFNGSKYLSREKNFFSIFHHFFKHIYSTSRFQICALLRVWIKKFEKTIFFNFWRFWLFTVVTRSQTQNPYLCLAEILILHKMSKKKFCSPKKKVFFFEKKYKIFFWWIYCLSFLFFFIFLITCLVFINNLSKKSHLSFLSISLSFLAIPRYRDAHDALAHTNQKYGLLLYKCKTNLKLGTDLLSTWDSRHIRFQESWIVWLEWREWSFTWTIFINNLKL